MTYTDQYVPELGSQEYNSQMSKWDEDKRPQQYAAVTITTFAATIAVVMRLYAQRTYKKGWGLDDLFVTIALLILYAEFVASVLSLKIGAGLHQVRVLHEDKNPPYGLQHIYTVSQVRNTELLHASSHHTSRITGSSPSSGPQVSLLSSSPFSFYISVYFLRLNAGPRSQYGPTH
ncbi:hypothetical protein N7451_006262 [Penicillium sp. IBT 35674x]|nr:hypothetical protein N7451_006262 [Penicillium sp. IBT 35674x]